MEKEFKDTMNKVWEAVKRISQDAYEKGKEYTMIAELRLKINSYNKEKNNIYSEIGQIVYDAHLTGEKELLEKGDLKSKCNKIDKISDKINTLEFEIKCIKEEHGIKDEDLEEVKKKAAASEKKASEPKKSTTAKKSTASKKSTGAKKTEK